MYKTIIVEDNPVTATMLAEMLKKSAIVEVLDMFTSPLKARKFLKNQPVDILFIDVEMPEINGLDFLRVLPEPPATIMITANREYAVDAFELNVVDFLVKPFTLPRLLTALNRAVELLEMKNARLNDIDSDYFFIRDGKTIKKLLLSEIFWFEAKGDYIRIQTATGAHLVMSSLKNIEEKLPGDLFIRIHRGYLISLKNLDSVENNVVNIRGTALPVSETYKPELLKKINLL